jgi:hypothetical protein
MNNREALLESARRLPQPPGATVNEFAAKREALVAAVNERLLNRNDLAQLVGAENAKMMTDNHANHARFVESYLGRMDPEVLVDTVLWVFRAYRAHGFRETYWSAQLNAWVEVLKAMLTPDAYTAIYPLYHWFIIHQPAFLALTEAAVAGPEPDAAQQTPHHGPRPL